MVLRPCFGREQTGHRGQEPGLHKEADDAAKHDSYSILPLDGDNKPYVQLTDLPGRGFQLFLQLAKGPLTGVR